MTGDMAAAQTASAAARVAQEHLVQEQPDYGPALAVLGLIEAGVGHKWEALRLGRRALELLPPERIRSAACSGRSARDHRRVGRGKRFRHGAGAQIQRAAFGWLALRAIQARPDGDPLRGDPRFEELVASLAPN